VNISKALSLTLKYNRHKLGLSQEELAYKCNLDRTYISLLERGKRNPTLNVLFSISSALNLTTSEFVKQIELIVQRND
jgi:transcriptional regulator with XRE-family HTH domain